MQLLEYTNGGPISKSSYFLAMFIRKKKNPSGVISVLVIDKSSSKYCVIKTILSSI